MQESEFVEKLNKPGSLVAYHNNLLIYIHTHVHALHKLTAISNTMVVAGFFVFILITWPEYHNTTNNIFQSHQAMVNGI